MGLAHPKSQAVPNSLPPTMENMRESPALSPVFEGRLYLRSENKQWQLRLFRFDGTTLTCLSTRKVKLPPGTRLDQSVVDLNALVMNRSPSASLTSPLLATPANKSRAKAGSNIAGYYQLPKWTINIADISAISVLKQNKKPNLFMTHSSLCFCIRTYDDRCYVLKAQKEKDLERWLFILTKMWNFATALRSHLNSESQQHSPDRIKDHLQNDDNLPLAQSVSPQTLAIITSKDHPPHSSNPSPHTPLSNIRKLVPPLPRENYGGLARHPTEQQAAPSDIYEQRYQMPQLSDEKAHWIDAWRNSLAELVASDPQIKVAPPVIEPIKDDDTMSLGSEMTSITTRARLKAEETEPKSVYPNTTNLRRRITSGSRHSARKPTLSRRKVSTAARLNIVAPVPEISAPVKEEKIELSNSEAEYMTPKMQRKRSNDVKNWLEPDRRPSYSRPVRTSSIRRPGFKRSEHVRPSSTPEVYGMNFFQTSTPSDETDSPIDTSATWPTPNAEVDGLKYHSSVRGKAIQLVKPTEKSKATLVKEDDNESIRSPSRSPTPTSKRSSTPMSQNPSRIPHHRSTSSLRSEQIVASSPLANIMVNNAQAKRHSDMSSLELRGAQRRRSSGGIMNDDMADSSYNNRGSHMVETQQTMWQKHYQLQQQQQQAAAIAAYQYPLTYGYGNMPSLVSPAIPPVALPPTLMSTFPRTYRTEQFPDDKHMRSTTSDTPGYTKRQEQQRGHHAMTETKGYHDTSVLSDELAQLRIRPKSSVAGSEVSSKPRKPESWMPTAAPPHDLRNNNRRSMDSFKLLDQRTAIRQNNHT